MSEATNIFYVSKKENLDLFVKKFMDSNQCCDRVEMVEKNDSWEVQFFPKQVEKKEVVTVKEIKKMPENMKSISDMFAMTATVIETQIVEQVKERTASIEKTMNDEVEKVKKKSSELDVIMADISKKAKEKMAALDATINAKFIEQDKKVEQKINGIWDLLEKIGLMMKRS